MTYGQGVSPLRRQIGRSHTIAVRMRDLLRRSLSFAAVLAGLDALVSVAGRVPKPEGLPLGPTSSHMAEVDGIDVYFLKGNASELGRDAKVLAGAQVDAMEASAEGEFRTHVPNGIAR